MTTWSEQRHGEVLEIGGRHVAGKTGRAGRRQARREPAIDGFTGGAENKLMGGVGDKGAADEFLMSTRVLARDARHVAGHAHRSGVAPRGAE